MQKDKIRKRCSLLFLLLIGFLASCNNDNSDNNDNSNNSETEYKDPEKVAMRTTILELVNEYRTKGYDSGTTYYPPTTPVVWNETLETVAQLHSDDMLANNISGHEGSDGSNPGDRLNRAGYSYSKRGECVARGQKSTEEVFNAWLNSPTHCSIMLGSGYEEIALARSETGNYWTLVLATPR